MNWKPKKIGRQKPDIKLVCKKVETERIRSVNKSKIDYKTIRTAFTTGIKPEEFLTALNPENGTYFGLKAEPTHTTKERLAMLGETLDESLDTGKGFEFPCENKKERKELLLTVATMLPNDWTMRIKGMYVKGLPAGGESDEEF